SYKGKRWYTVRPTHRVRGVGRFMAHWRYLAESFLEHRVALDALIVRYEDLRPDSDVLNELEDRLCVCIRRETLAERVGQRLDKHALRISPWERVVARVLTDPVAKALGYTGLREVSPRPGVLFERLQATIQRPLRRVEHVAAQESVH
ncbi:MAG: hypothetical protein KF861_24705, partial [Planctomycetaceae bacterium]|nr:hypothetical protein [Planctomycetaceae bacterium]